MQNEEPAAGCNEDDDKERVPGTPPQGAGLALTEEDLAELRKPPLRFRELPLGDGLKGFVLMREDDTRDPVDVFRARLRSCLFKDEYGASPDGQNPSGGTKPS